MALGAPAGPGPDDGATGTRGTAGGRARVASSAANSAVLAEAASPASGGKTAVEAGPGSTEVSKTSAASGGQSADDQSSGRRPRGPCGGGAGSFMSGPFRVQWRATTVLEAWARGRTVRESILTWAGRSRVHTMHSATSEAVSGASTPA